MFFRLFRLHQVDVEARFSITSCFFAAQVCFLQFACNILCSQIHATFQISALPMVETGATNDLNAQKQYIPFVYVFGLTLQKILLVVQKSGDHHLK